MLASLALAAAALRAGLAIRRARRLRLPAAPSMRRRHLRLAKPAVLLVLAGLAGGEVSAVWLRGMEPLASLHALAAVPAAALFAAAGLLGRRLERGRASAREAHARAALAAAFFAAAAVATGLVLLP
jgi:hypothetical protein